ncbi:MAG: Asp23/Gls24 family envelope stress response protein [Clostridia bacterium]|nr:Asp23/Gls24 family envelope stress response protein [Clostridia bacterium]
MIRMENHLGKIEISQNYFAGLIGNAASSCFGVAGMCKAGTRQGLRDFFTDRDYIDQGVKVHVVNRQLIIDLHITVIYGMNISAITKSIVNKVRYTVESATGLNVRRVNVHVDGMKA